jgi:hypothetical protein
MTIETELALLEYRRTKFVATLGPAPSEEAVIAQPSTRESLFAQ